MACFEQGFGSLVQRREWSMWVPTWLRIFLKVIFPPQRRHSTGFLGSSFGFGITPSGNLSTNNVSAPVVSRYGKELELLIEGNDSTCPNIFSVFGSSDSQRESMTAQRSSRDDKQNDEISTGCGTKSTRQHSHFPRG